MNNNIMQKVHIIHLLNNVYFLHTSIFEVNMNKQEMALLEKAYSCEIEAALSKNGIHIMQTKSKLAKKLVADGLLKEVSMHLPASPWPCTLDGYELTELGRMVFLHKLRCITIRLTCDTHHVYKQGE